MTVLGPADAPEVLPVIEIETEEPFYTFRAHYDPGAATMREAGPRRRAARARGGRGRPGLHGGRAAATWGAWT